MNIRDILKKRNCGFLNIQCVNYYNEGLEKLLPRLGLAAKPEALTEISREIAGKIIRTVLWHDLAYGSEIMPEHEAQLFAQQLMNELTDADSRFYTNSDWSEVDGKPFLSSWSELTEATFDAGIIIVNLDYAAVVWVQDED